MAPLVAGMRNGSNVKDPATPAHRRRQIMAQLESRNIETSHETRKFQANGHLDVVTLGDFTMGRGTFQPGWQWSRDVKPIAGTGSCMAYAKPAS